MSALTVFPSSNPDLQQLIYLRTNIAGYFFDAFLRVEHTTKVTITENPVEIGAAVADNAFIMPAQLIMEVGMSDAAMSYVAGQFEGGWSRSSTAYAILLELQKQRIPFQVHTRLNLYQNMLIESIVVSDDYKSLYTLKATVTFKEVFLAVVQTVKISAREQVTGSTSSGTVQPVSTDSSALYKINHGGG